MYDHDQTEHSALLSGHFKLERVTAGDTYCNAYVRRWVVDLTTRHRSIILLGLLIALSPMLQQI
jgi:hypothetical protein